MLRTAVLGLAAMLFAPSLALAQGPGRPGPGQFDRAGPQASLMQAIHRLSQRVDRLEKELATLRAGGLRSVRRRADWSIGNFPAWEVAVGPDPEKEESRGHAKAWVAVATRLGNLACRQARSRRLR